MITKTTDTFDPLTDARLLLQAINDQFEPTEDQAIALAQALGTIALADTLESIAADVHAIAEYADLIYKTHARIEKIYQARRP